MWEVSSWFILFIITHFLDCIIFSKVVNDKKFKCSGKMVIIIILFSIIDIYVDQNCGYGSRTLVTNINTIMLLKILYNESLVKTIVFSLISYIIFAASSIFSTVVLNIVGFISLRGLMKNVLDTVILNILIYSIYIIIFTRKRSIKIIKKIMNWYKDNEVINTIIMVVLAGIYLYTLGYGLLIRENPSEEMIIFIVFFICSVIFVSGFFKQRSNNNELQTKYEAVNEYLKTHERLLAEKSREQHEHKNQLVLMRDMVHKNNRKLLEYIDKELKRQEMKEEYIYIKKLKNIPEGGLKGLIHYKIESMLESKLEVYVDVSSKLSKKSRWKNLENDLRDISMSLGVYIDNAIEAAKESKRKSVMIEVEYEEGQIIFEISNTYQDGIKGIGEEGYTTKGIGRGQGLTLVKEIIDGNKRLKEQREIQRSYYVQKLIYDCQ